MKSRIKNILLELKPYVIIVITVVLIRSFIVTPGLVNGPSMEDTLYNNDVVVVNKISLLGGIDRFQIVVIDYDNDTLIKRVIGLPGETVEYKDNKLFINGDQIIAEKEFPETNDFTLTAKDDEYIVLGDNRSISKDSRIIGPVKKDQIRGKVGIVLYPFKRFGLIK